MNGMMNTQWDVVVVGGGLSGVAAAIAARRQGSQHVLLIEQGGGLGGAAIHALVNPFMAFHTTVNGQHFQVNRGIFEEMRQKMMEVGAYEDKRPEIHEEYMKIALDRMVTQAGVTCLFHATVYGVEKVGEQLQAVQVLGKGRKMVFRSKVFIDCTGDANLSVLSGVPCRVGREADGLCQPMTLCFRVANVDIPLFEKNRENMQKLYKQYQQEGKITNPRENILIFYTRVDNCLHFNTTRVVKMDPTDPFQVTKAEMIAREQMLEMHRFLKDNIPGFENSQIVNAGTEIGVRESRMIDGEYVLNEQDLKSCTKFEDAVAAGNYEIDIHNPEGTGTYLYYFEPGTWYTIPYRSLQPKNACNLLVAGRCISSTHEAQSAYRVMPIIMCIGEAAGVAAALAARQDGQVKQVDVRQVQALLRESGAFIGD